MLRSRPVLFALLLLPVVAAPAEAQFGRGLQRYRAQGTSSYQFGYTPTFEITVMNASLQDLEFHLAAYKTELQKWTTPDTTWVVGAGTYGTTGITALEMRGYFVSRRGVRIPAVVDRGTYYATFYVDEELLRAYESRDPKGAIVIRTFEGFRNPDLPESRLTTLTDATRLARRSLDLLPSPYERPGREGEFLVLERTSFDDAGTDDDGSIALKLDDADRAGATSGRIRQPGENLITIDLFRANGDVPAGARFSARVGHELAYRTETGDVNGEGRIKLFATRDPNVRIDVRLTGAGLPEGTTFSIVPATDSAFKIRLR